MRFSRRTFLWVFFPFLAMMGLNFWLIRASVTAAVRDGLRETVLQNQKQLAEERVRVEQRMNRVLRVVAENPSLKAGVQLMLDERSKPGDARRTVEDQLSEICDSLGFSFLVVFDAAGRPIAGIERRAGGFAPMSLGSMAPPQTGLYSANGKVYQITSVPVNQGAEEIGVLAVGEEFMLSGLATPAMLIQDGRVISTGGIQINSSDIEPILNACANQTECEVHLGTHTYLSFRLAGDFYPGAEIQVRSLQDVDAAASPVLASLRRIFLSGTALSVFAAAGIAMVSSGSIVRPLAALVHRLHLSTKTGTLQELPVPKGGTVELRELTEGFNQAAAAIRQGRERLVTAYIEFTGSLAEALDARDRYTAGHSKRVSEYAVAIGRVMNLPFETLEILRIGGLLHDIGKIGVADAVLQKPGRLTPEEEASIREHPVIGRRILEGVHGLEMYIPVVELHHENWDGAGYPHGYVGDHTPLAARIVKVADAYDAMTTDRPYRAGMSHAEAAAVIEKFSGSQLDPDVVRAFSRVSGVGKIPVQSDLANLAEAVGTAHPVTRTTDSKLLGAA